MPPVANWSYPTAIRFGAGRAAEIADAIEPEPFRRLLYYLVDTVLDRREEKAVETITPPVAFQRVVLREALIDLMGFRGEALRVK